VDFLFACSTAGARDCCWILCNDCPYSASTRGSAPHQSDAHYSTSAWSMHTTCYSWRSSHPASQRHTGRPPRSSHTGSQSCRRREDGMGELSASARKLNGANRMRITFNILEQAGDALKLYQEIEVTSPSRSASRIRSEHAERADSIALTQYCRVVAQDSQNMRHVRCLMSHCHTPFPLYAIRACRSARR
jgi:hypothetical protein